MRSPNETNADPLGSKISAFAVSDSASTPKVSVPQALGSAASQPEDRAKSQQSPADPKYKSDASDENVLRSNLENARHLKEHSHHFSCEAQIPGRSSTFCVIEEILRFPGDFKLERGATLHNLEVPYRMEGPEDAPVVVVLGGISANRIVCQDPGNDSPGWWRKLIGWGQAVNTQKLRVLSFDYLGRHPEQLFAGDRLLSITTGDQARVLQHILDELHIESLHALVGASYGAMVGCRFAADFGSRIQHLVAISGAHKAHPMATAWRSIQRNIVRMGLAHDATNKGLALARALAMTTYRSPHEFAERFDGLATEVDGLVKFPVEHYLEQRGNDFLRYFTPESFIILSESIDLHRVNPEDIQCDTTVIGVNSDVLVPVSHSEELATGLAQKGTLHKIDSLFGHDAFLKEIEQLSHLLAQNPLFA